MTKIAHPGHEHEQDLDVAGRNDRGIGVARATAKAGADVAHESVQLAQSATEALAQNATDAAENLRDTTRQLAEQSRQIAEESPAVGRAFAELIGEQSRQSADMLTAFARAVNWTDLAQAQSKLIAGSILRISQFNARYSQFLLRGMTATASFPRH